MIMSPIKARAGGPVLYVDVWNCQARLAVEEENTHRIIDVPDGLPGRFEKVAERIIYEENHGAINISGLYYLKSDRSSRILLRIFNACQEANGKPPALHASTAGAPSPTGDCRPMGDEALYDETGRIAGWRCAFCKEVTRSDQAHSCPGMREWHRNGRRPRRAQS